MGRLANTSGAEIAGKITQNRFKMDPAYYIGKGKIETILRQAQELACNIILFNNELSPSHVKNLQKLAGESIKILDRTGIIIDIFSQHAQTSESRKQVELAQLEYFLPRLSRQWTHLERQMGGIGTRGGPGETQIEIDRRLVRNRISRLKKELKKISQQRFTQSKSRDHAYRVSLVGYTNAGKSTILKSLTGENVYIKDQLFATLDTTTRRLDLGEDLPVLMSDTVGFIHNLPHSLIASFRSTLSEVRHANLLIKVVDAASPRIEHHLNTIDEVLHSIGTHNQESLLVFNKIDLLNGDKLKKLKNKHPDSLFISAEKQLRISHFKDSILEFATKDNVDEEICIPYENSAILDQIYSNFIVCSRKEKKEGYVIKVSGRRERIENLKIKVEKIRAEYGAPDTL